MPHPADAPAARHRLRAELARPVDAAAPQPRAVLLCHSDGNADLVLSAHRSVLDPRSLRVLADVLAAALRADGETARAGAGGRSSRGSSSGQLSSSEPALPPPVAPGSALWQTWAAADYVQHPGWATPESGAADRTAVLRTALTTGPALGPTDVSASLAVAAALVLGRYEGQERPLLAAITPDPGRPPRALGAHDFATLLAPDLSGAHDLPTLVTSARRQLRDTSQRCDAPGYLALTERAGGRVLVGLLPEASEGQVPCHSAPFPLTLVPRRDPDGGLWLETHHRLLDVDPDSARRFTHHVARAYEAIAAATPGTRPGDLDPLDREERERLIAMGAGGTLPPHPPARIDALFMALATACPDAIALVYEDERTTYARLLRRARQLAAGLLAQGARPGEHIGVCLERSTDLVVTLLAVLLADGVYVPMDPAYPAARLADTARDAGLRLLVTELPELPGTDGIRLLPPAALAKAGATAPMPPAPGRGPDEAAYIIYTSGSTGRPKGVVVPHRNVVALLEATRTDLALGPQDVWSLFHSSAFDFSVWEIWGALLTGARLVVVPYWVSRSPDEFHALLAKEGVTLLSQTPSAFGQLVEADLRQDALLPVRLVVFGGEPLDTAPLSRWFDRYPESRCRLVNMFGITETTVHVTAQTVWRRHALAGSRSVGRTLPGWQVYVLDAHGRPLPCGAPGEIHVAGAGVATGYWNRPELTEQRFVPDPFLGGLMYRSGDRGRLRPDGSLEHLGRLDSQVKVRGFRIELDEIRAVLLDDPSVRFATVVLGGSGPGGDAAEVRIDAYVVPAEGAEADPLEVRRRAARTLPEFMVPAGVTVLASLPLTVNGKVDVARLPAPEAARPRNVPTAPPGTGSGPSSGNPGDTTDLAGMLARIWQEVLGVPVGPQDNFFELGGNSLYAVRVAAAVRDRGLPPVPLRALYRTPTVSALAEALASESWQ
ncbi:amino acid adenylation domain-containing protein [Streptomyces goshikiensis]|uniref:amino acid adenylation domain-containing protein n=1 Tax=Streptomyces goshikiensis TaxID=1942 RepID=UPI00366423AD